MYFNQHFCFTDGLYNDGPMLLFKKRSIVQIELINSHQNWDEVIHNPIWLMYILKNSVAICLPRIGIMSKHSFFSSDLNFRWKGVSEWPWRGHVQCHSKHYDYYSYSQITKTWDWCWLDTTMCHCNMVQPRGSSPGHFNKISNRWFRVSLQ